MLRSQLVKSVSEESKDTFESISKIKRGTFESISKIGKASFDTISGEGKVRFDSKTNTHFITLGSSKDEDIPYPSVVLAVLDFPGIKKPIRFPTKIVKAAQHSSGYFVKRIRIPIKYLGQIPINISEITYCLIIVSKL